MLAIFKERNAMISGVLLPFGQVLKGARALSAWILRGNVVAAVLAIAVLAAPTGVYAKEAKKSPMDKKVEEIWGKKRGIKVVQHRVFEKTKRWEFGLFVGSIPNDEIWNYWPVGARINYFVFESLGIELVGAYIPSSKTKLFAFLDDTYSNFQMKKLERLVYYAGFNGFWAPIHGKINIFNKELSHFDVGLNFGAGVLGTKTKENVTSDWLFQKVPSIYGEIGLGVQIYLTKSWALRFDYRHYFYRAAGGGVSMPAEFTLGFGWFTAAPE